MTPDTDREAKALAVRLATCDQSQKLHELKAWVNETQAKYGDRAVGVIHTLTTLISAGQTGTMGSIVVGSVTMNDNSTNVHGNVTASAVGKGANFTANDVTVYETRVDQSKSINPDFKNSLKDARQAIADVEGDVDTRDHVLKNFDELTTELEKEKPNPGKIKTIWAGITSFAGGAAAIAKFGEVLAKYFGFST